MRLNPLSIRWIHNCLTGRTHGYRLSKICLARSRHPSHLLTMQSFRPITWHPHAHTCILRICLFSPHGIVTPKGLYFTAEVSSSFFFFRRLISEVTERISTKLGHIFTHDCYFKNLLQTPRAFIPPRAGGKTLFWNRLPTLTKNISATEHDINNRKEILQSTGTPLHAPKFGELCSTNSWKRKQWVPKTHGDHFCVKFGDPNCIRFWDIVQISRQTHKRRLTPYHCKCRRCG